MNYFEQIADLECSIRNKLYEFLPRIKNQKFIQTFQPTGALPTFGNGRVSIEFSCSEGKKYLNVSSKAFFNEFETSTELLQIQTEIDRMMCVKH